MLILSPYSRVTQDGRPNAKNFPHWQAVVNALKDEMNIIQIGTKEEPRLENVTAFLKPKLSELKDLLKGAKCFASVDNFLQHYVRTYIPTLTGVVVFSKSDPRVFGYPQNTNLLKDKKYLRNRQEQWWLWSQTNFDADAFVEPSVVVKAIKEVYYAWDDVVK